MMLPPVTLSLLPPRGDWAGARAATRRHLALTHDSASLAQAADVYAKLLYDVAQGGDLRAGAKAAAQALGVDVERYARSGMDDTSVVQRLGSACYITSSLPVVLYLAYKHGDSFEDAVLANVNAGGENAHRGSALGALVGAAVGKSVRVVWWHTKPLVTPTKGYTGAVYRGAA